MSCASTCTSTRFARSAPTSRPTSPGGAVARRDQLPALSFTPSVQNADPDRKNRALHVVLSPTAHHVELAVGVGVDNVLVTGALMAFQNANNLPTTASRIRHWNDLVNAAEAGQVDAQSYNYVSVSETQPETLTLYVAAYPRSTPSSTPAFRSRPRHWAPFRCTCVTRARP